MVGLVKRTWALKKKRVKASTLFESLVAMVIVLLCFAGVTTLFVNVSESSNNQQRTIAISIIDSYMADNNEIGAYQDDELKVGGMTLVSKIEKYGDVQGLKMSVIRINGANGKMLAERRDLIIEK